MHSNSSLGGRCCWGPPPPKVCCPLEFTARVLGGRSIAPRTSHMSSSRRPSAKEGCSTPSATMAGVRIYKASVAAGWLDMPRIPTQNLYPHQ